MTSNLVDLSFEDHACHRRSSYRNHDSFWLGRKTFTEVVVAMCLGRRPSKLEFFRQPLNTTRVWTLN